jgi:hypothetical protein
MDPNSKAPEEVKFRDHKWGGIFGVILKCLIVFIIIILPGLVALYLLTNGGRF